LRSESAVQEAEGRPIQPAMDDPTGAKYGIAFSEWTDPLAESFSDPLCPTEVMRVYVEETALDIYKVRQSLQLPGQYLYVLGRSASTSMANIRILFLKARGQFRSAR